jgi:hypothetical protein
MWKDYVQHALKTDHIGIILQVYNKKEMIELL